MGCPHDDDGLKTDHGTVLTIIVVEKCNSFKKLGTPQSFIGMKSTPRLTTRDHVPRRTDQCNLHTHVIATALTRINPPVEKTVGCIDLQDPREVYAAFVQTILPPRFSSDSPPHAPRSTVFGFTTCPAPGCAPEPVSSRCCSVTPSPTPLYRPCTATSRLACK